MGDTYLFQSADHRNNVLCLSCHSEGGSLAMIQSANAFADISKDDVANLHVDSGGTVFKNQDRVAPAPEEINASKARILNAVSKHMFVEANMLAPYNPTNEALPVGRCTTCHMPKLAKSGGYVTGADANGNKALVEGDQASHVFDIVWPWQSNALSRGGPTFQSGYYGQFMSPTNQKYDQFGYMPNSCGKCHTQDRKASIYCPDSTAVFPSYWPYSEHPNDPYWSNCFTSSAAP
jgi:hypothetical protein